MFPLTDLPFAAAFLQAALVEESVKPVSYTHLTDALEKVRPAYLQKIMFVGEAMPTKQLDVYKRQSVYCYKV